MRRLEVMVVLILATGLALVGCSKENQTTARTDTTAMSGTGASADTAVAAGSGHAEGIVPGSYEDWCDEHQVQETMCTRCDPSLIPAFKASGDWDEKHGLPKSQCLKCDPTLRIVRPPKV